MPHNVTRAYVILAQTSCTCLRAVQTPAGYVLQRFSLGESAQIELTHYELQTWLQFVPSAILLEALAAQGWTGEPPPPSPIADLCICGHAGNLHEGVWTTYRRCLVPRCPCEDKQAASLPAPECACTVPGTFAPELCNPDSGCPCACHRRGTAAAAPASSRVSPTATAEATTHIPGLAAQSLDVRSATTLPATSSNPFFDLRIQCLEEPQYRPA